MFYSYNYFFLQDDQLYLGTKGESQDGSAQTATSSMPFGFGWCPVERLASLYYGWNSPQKAEKWRMSVLKGKYLPPCSIIPIFAQPKLSPPRREPHKHYFLGRYLPILWFFLALGWIFKACNPDFSLNFFFPFFGRHAFLVDSVSIRPHCDIQPISRVYFLGQGSRERERYLCWQIEWDNIPST